MLTRFELEEAIEKLETAKSLIEPARKILRSVTSDECKDIFADEIANISELLGEINEMML